MIRKRNGFDTFLKKVQDTYFKLNPFLIAVKNGVTADEVLLNYRAYEPFPSNLKRITEHAKAFMRELQGKT